MTTSTHVHKPSPPNREDRVKLLVAAYEHGMEHNTPRHPTELAELKELLGVKAEKKD